VENNNNNQDKKGKYWWQPPVFLFLKFSSWVVAPVLLAAFLGKWLDNKYDSEPWIFLFAVGTAFLVSILGLIKTVTEEYRRLEKSGDKTKQDKNNNKQDKING